MKALNPQKTEIARERARLREEAMQQREDIAAEERANSVLLGDARKLADETAGHAKATGGQSKRLAESMAV